MQQKIAFDIFGGYRTTNKEKLLRLLGLYRIDEDLIIKQDTLDLDKNIRAETTRKLDKMFRDEKENYGDYDIDN